MAGITLAQAEAKLTLYLDALDKIVLKQKVEIDGQALTRANLADVQNAVTYWDAKVKELSAKASGRGRMRTLTPRG
ncbi:hypothetical protein [Dechloromonas sp. CZR5]|uniref:hypothetical protein n=1 Tax=Dechloromonas sp. CZR5 TaxID=2608630 RepID=UPI00123D40D6|nr:hypothetical protein [Dechloromonas sp. CZR5]